MFILRLFVGPIAHHSAEVTCRTFKNKTDDRPNKQTKSAQTPNDPIEVECLRQELLLADERAVTILKLAFVNTRPNGFADKLVL